jgi:rubrerythrin
MPDFGAFKGLKFDRPLTKEELIRSIRFMVSAEYEAIEMYSQISDATTDKRIKKAIEDVTEEERKHAGEFLKMLSLLDPDEIKFYQEGFKEVEENIKKAIQPLSHKIKNLATTVIKYEKIGIKNVF